MDGRKRWSAKEKLQVLKECQESGATVSEVCRRRALNTSQYYQWLKQSEEATLESFQNGKKEKASRREEKLRQQLERMKSVVVEITMENLDLKKTLGS